MHTAVCCCSRYDTHDRTQQRRHESVQRGKGACGCRHSVNDACRPAKLYLQFLYIYSSTFMISHLEITTAPVHQYNFFRSSFVKKPNRCDEIRRQQQLNGVLLMCLSGDEDECKPYGTAVNVYNVALLFPSTTFRLLVSLGTCTDNRSSSFIHILNVFVQIHHYHRRCVLCTLRIVYTSYSGLLLQLSLVLHAEALLRLLDCGKLYIHVNTCALFLVIRGGVSHGPCIYGPYQYHAEYHEIYPRTYE